MAINDFWYENLKSMGITESSPCYYITRAKDIKELPNGKMAIPQTSAIMNAFYLPYLYGDSQSWVASETLTESANIFPVNVNNLASPDGVKYGETVRTRIISIPDDLKNVELGTCQIFNTDGKDVGGNFKWQNEGKLHFYPYTYLQYIDNISNPITILPQWVTNPNDAKLKVRHALNLNGCYLLYVNGYRGDTTGFVNGVLTDGINIPVGSNPYVDWVMINQNKIENQRAMNNIGIVGGLVGGTIQAGASLATGNALGVVGGLGTMASGIVNAMKYEMNLMAEERDSMNQPSSIQNVSGNQAFFRQMSEGGIQFGMREVRYRYNEADLERIANYFHMYGYAQNRLMLPNYKSRKYWNYVRTSDVNIKCNGCPKEHLAILKMIFNNGVTVHHVERAEMHSVYNKDNVEI